MTEYNNSRYLVTRLLCQYVRPYLRRLLMAVGCMVVAAVSTAAFALIIQDVIDDIFVNKDSTKLAIISLSVLFIFVVRGVATYGHNYIMQCLGQRIITNMQMQLYKHLLTLDLAQVTGEASGKVISRFTNDINILRASMVIVTTGLAKELLTLVLLVAVMFYQSFTLSVITFLAFPVAIYPIMRLGRRMRKISNATQEELGEFTARLDETFKSAHIIKAYQQEKFEITRSSKTVEKVYALYKKAARNQSASSPMMEIIGGAAIAAVFWYGGSQVINSDTTAGMFMSFITAVTAAYKPAKSLSNMNTTLQDGLAAARRLFVLLDTQPEIIDHDKAINLRVDNKNAQISFDKVYFSYVDDKPALRGISLEVAPGETIALVGPSGGGKSTIMNLLLRFYEADKGQIAIANHDIKDIKIAALRDSISYVSQHVALFDDSVAANIAYGSKKSTRDEIIKAAKNAAADDFIKDLPKGYDTVIGQNGMTLSGGQRQRLSIARAMLRNSPILLLDEATSALDSISEKKIQSALKKLMKGRTTIVIAHRLSTIEHADNIYVVKNGKVVESGKHADLLKKKGEYCKLHVGLKQ